MGGNFVRWLGLGVAVGIGLQPAQAGDRKSVNIQRVAVSARTSHFDGQLRSSGNNSVAAPIRMPGGAERAFSHVTPFESRLAATSTNGSRQREEQKGSGPTSTRARRTITLLQFNPNISLQPVVGSVNGAQLSLDF